MTRKFKGGSPDFLGPSFAITRTFKGEKIRRLFVILFELRLFENLNSYLPSPSLN